MTRARRTALLALAAAAVLGCRGDADPLVERGRALSVELGCTACHAVDAASEEHKIGPSWVKLYGSDVLLQDGTVAPATEAYLRESILRPDAAIVDGFPPRVMVEGLGGVARSRLEDDALVDALVAFIRSLR